MDILDQQLLDHNSKKFIPTIGDFCRHMNNKVFIVGKDQNDDYVFQVENTTALCIGSLEYFSPLKSDQEEQIEYVKSLLVCNIHYDNFNVDTVSRLLVIHNMFDTSVMSK
jgi:hypothetical protein